MGMRHHAASQILSRLAEADEMRSKGITVANVAIAFANSMTTRRRPESDLWRAEEPRGQAPLLSAIY